MKSTLGWTLLSREALRRAEASLSEENQGVIDELGVLAIHTAYGERFFPGTSVLLTRARYVCFVPWIYHRAMQVSRRGRLSFDDALEREEVRLAGRLNESGQAGVIGGRVYPKPTSQPPSSVYWRALRVWGILRPAFDGSHLRRAAVHRLLRGTARRAQKVHDDEGRSLEEDFDLFCGLPAPPEAWTQPNDALDFVLTASEARFLRSRLLQLVRRHDGQPCLLARLTEQRLSVQALQHPWERAVRNVADSEDKQALLNARDAAETSAVARAVYAALVETACEEDGNPQGARHRDHLERCVERHRSAALNLDVPALLVDVPGMSALLAEVFRELQAWLEAGAGPIPERLRDLCTAAELARKGSRARLPQTYAGLRRRNEWCAHKHPLAKPLHYRWPNVQRLLTDLNRDPA